MLTSRPPPEKWMESKQCLETLHRNQRESKRWFHHCHPEFITKTRENCLMYNWHDLHDAIPSGSEALTGAPAGHLAASSFIQREQERQRGEWLLVPARKRTSQESWWEILSHRGPAHKGHISLGLGLEPATSVQGRSLAARGTQRAHLTVRCISVALLFSGLLVLSAPFDEWDSIIGFATAIRKTRRRVEREVEDGWHEREFVNIQCAV